MPYALAERQREYQRLWAKSLRNKRTDRISFGNRTIENLDGTTNLKSRVITWEELTAEKLEKITTYKECVEKAKSFILGRKINRIAIASLALRSCIIKRGGGRRGEDYNAERDKKHITTFAAKIGVHPKTLHRWITIKKEIVDELGAHEKSIDYTAADEAIKNCKQWKMSPVKAYRRAAAIDPFYYKGRLLVRYLQNAAKILTTLGVKHFDDELIHAANVHLAQINKHL